MKENKYDDNIFFQKYSQMSRSQQGLAGAGEWETLRKLLPDFKDKRVLDLGCGYGWHCIYAMEESQLLQENETLSLEIKEYISRQDAAELAGVSVSTVTKWMQSGEFQCVGAGKVLRVHRQQFLNWLNEHREGVV